MNIIHKAQFDPGNTEQTFQLPFGAEILSVVAKQNGLITFWYLFQEGEEAIDSRTLQIVPTGASFPEEYYHVATLFDGPFVWHLIEVYN